MGHAKELGRGVSRPKTAAVEIDRGPQSFATAFPRLQSFLADPLQTPEGPQTGCMTVFFEDGRYKLCLNDRPKGQSCFVSSTILAECYRIAERGFQSKTLRWRVKGYKRPQERTLNI